MSAVSKSVKKSVLPGSDRTAALLYWLLVVCGLAGLTLLRMDTPHEIAGLWIGSATGVGLGHLVARLRVRAWVLVSVAMMMAWVSPVLFFLAYDEIRPATEMGVLAFVPAFVCAYLSLSERGGLVAFWYPVVLWMLVILDGQRTFDARASLPMLLGLGALFVAFLRAREARRVALWQQHGIVRLGVPVTRKVLRGSPLRASLQHGWTAFVGLITLALAAWIAPTLWREEQHKHAREQAAAAASYSDSLARAAGDTPCCKPGGDEDHAQVREYFTMRSTPLADERTAAAGTCRACSAYGRGDQVATAARDSYGTSSWSYGSYGTPGYAATPGPLSGADSPWAVPQPAVVGTPPHDPAFQTPAPVVPLDHVVAPVAPAPPHATPKPSTAPPRPVHVKPRAAGPSVPPTPAANATEDEGTPWRTALLLAIGLTAAHMLARAVRRQLRLRHLARPFWNETIDQRISNHWERVLIGLRDAGIYPGDDEPPQALAERVQREGISGLEACATILERVRHGVRVEAGDLDTMAEASESVYRAARERAGLSGRAASLWRAGLA